MNAIRVKRNSETGRRGIITRSHAMKRNLRLHFDLRSKISSRFVTEKKNVLSSSFPSFPSLPLPSAMKRGMDDDEDYHDEDDFRTGSKRHKFTFSNAVYVCTGDDFEEADVSPNNPRASAVQDKPDTANAAATDVMRITVEETAAREELQVHLRAALKIRLDVGHLSAISRIGSWNPWKRPFPQDEFDDETRSAANTAKQMKQRREIGLSEKRPRFSREHSAGLICSNPPGFEEIVQKMSELRLDDVPADALDAFLTTAPEIPEDNSDW